MIAPIKFLMMFVVIILPVMQKQVNRNIMIFADKATNSNLIQQVNILKADAKGTHDRNITYQIITYSAATVAAYKKWGVSNVPFTVLLIGKDNGEKMRSHEPVTLSRLYALIDNMPMRKQEIEHDNLNK